MIGDNRLSSFQSRARGSLGGNQIVTGQGKQCAFAVCFITLIFRFLEDQIVNQRAGKSLHLHLQYSHSFFRLLEDQIVNRDRKRLGFCKFRVHALFSGVLTREVGLKEK
jgi:hypothetical protein